MKFLIGTPNFENEFPNKITEDFRTNQDGTCLAIINRFPVESVEFDLANPQMDGLCVRNHQFLLNRLNNPNVGESAEDSFVFYHVIKNNIASVRRAIEAFLKHDRKKDGDLQLCLVKNDEVLQYSWGEIVPDCIENQAKYLNVLPEDYDKENAFIIPLKVHFFECPICGMPTLEDRGCYSICPECMWEDDGREIDGEGVLSDAASAIQNFIYFSGLAESNINSFTPIRYRDLYKKAKELHPDLSGNELYEQMCEIMNEESDDGFEENF